MSREILISKAVARRRDRVKKAQETTPVMRYCPICNCTHALGAHINYCAKVFLGVIR